MQIIQTIEKLPETADASPLALTIGNFDGVHIGHQQILQTLVAQAKGYHLAAAVMTFTPHAKVFFENHKNFLITSDAEKAHLIAQSGIERLYQIPFDKVFSKQGASAFIDVLIHQLRVKYLLVGDDFRFGYRGQGDFTLLREACEAHGVLLQRTPTVTWLDQRVSSSRIRHAIADAKFELVEQLLGRSLAYSGLVQHGQKLGRKIDMPTANLHLPETRLLPAGVFAVKVNIEDDENTYHGMCNIGARPTVSEVSIRKIEVNIFDFDADVYGKKITLIPVAKLRNEQKFNGVDKLAAQLQRDKQQALIALHL